MAELVLYSKVIDVEPCVFKILNVIACSHEHNIIYTGFISFVDIVAKSDYIRVIKLGGGINLFMVKTETERVLW